MSLIKNLGPITFAYDPLFLFSVKSCLRAHLNPPWPNCWTHCTFFEHRPWVRFWINRHLVLENPSAVCLASCNLDRQWFGWAQPALWNNFQRIEIHHVSALCMTYPIQSSCWLPSYRFFGLLCAIGHGAPIRHQQNKPPGWWQKQRMSTKNMAHLPALTTNDLQRWSA